MEKGRKNIKVRKRIKKRGVKNEDTNEMFSL
jgi:hypothetical protein